MKNYENGLISNILKENTYPGRGIIIGKSASGEYAVAAYFIMGRSVNSRNRVFLPTDDGIIIKPFDESKVADPSLIIYSPVRTYKNSLIVTNGNQTDTVFDFLADGKSFEQALETRCFEPDVPNYTPRISGIIDFKDGGFTYKLSVLKSADENGTVCDRYTFSYGGIDGVGHFVHTYDHDGNPIPSFTGEPERISIGNDIDFFTDELWNNLNEQNKVSLYVCYTDLKTGKRETRIENKNK